jgi:hypothetical protein
MRSPRLHILAIAFSLIVAQPVLADQSRGGGQRSGAVAGGQQGRADRMQDQTRLRDVDKDQDRLRDRDRDRDQIYGSQLMTTSERSAYRKKMRSLKTSQEREAFRTQHHEEMQKRAAARGVTLPEVPPARQGQGRMGTTGGIQQRTEQQTEQQQRNQQQDQQIQQRERTQQEQQSQEGGG